MSQRTRLSCCLMLSFAAIACMTQRETSARSSVGVPLGSPARCASYDGLPERFGRAGEAGMVWIPGGTVVPGTMSGYADERPAGAVRLEPFWMDRTEVTNAQFAAFVKATGHVTQAEREGAAAVFRAPPPGRHVPEGSWWVWTRGADWRHPEGPGSDLRGRDHEPVVLVALADALAYARWLGRDLPTEAEWEHAARGNGAPEKLEREPRDGQGRPTANFWQGVFPDVNALEDGFARAAPVGCFAANGAGLHDMIGNVWELTRDPYRGPRQPHGSGDVRARVEQDGAPRRQGEAVVIKGGSFLCAANYCMRYRSTARHPQESDMATSHVGFRTVKRVSPARRSSAPAPA